METIISLFNSNQVRYLLIGGQAVRLFGMPRYSMDWDLYIPGRDLDNIKIINLLLSGVIDMDLEPLGDKGQNFIQTYQTEYGIIQFHLAPLCLPPFDQAEKRSVTAKSETGLEIKCLSPEDLYECKKKVNRPKDEADILFLERKLKILKNI